MNSTQKKLEKLKDELLLATLPHIVFDGWSREALLAGTKSLGLKEGYPYTLFADPSRELVTHFSQWADRKMIENLSQIDLRKMKIRDRVAVSVRCRLEVISEHKEAIRRSLLYISPRSLYDTVDIIWRNVGDLSVDFNFYTKRALLASVISSTTIFWLTDQSDKNKETWDFLDRRIENVLKIPILRAKVLAQVTPHLNPIERFLNLKSS